MVSGSKCNLYVIQEVTDWYHQAASQGLINPITGISVTDPGTFPDGERVRFRIHAPKYDWPCVVSGAWERGNQGYMGWFLSCRQSGKGNDKADGRYNHKTFLEAVDDINKVE